MKPENLIAWATTLSLSPETPVEVRDCLAQLAEALKLSLYAERGARKDYESLEYDAAKVVLAHLHGDSFELDETVGKMMNNGRDKWWEAHRPAGLRGEVDFGDDP
jgi:hypothetical protein